jgi:hypothetical protein
VTKWQKIRKDLEWVNCVFKVSYGILRKVGNPELVSENPRVGSSILSLGTRKSPFSLLAVRAFLRKSVGAVTQRFMVRCYKTDQE